MVVRAELKPAALTVILADLLPAPTIVFTSSVEATRRLAIMLRALSNWVGTAVEYSAAMAPKARRAALDAFKSSQATVLVCSDAMTRGMDVVGVEAVVNYDAPVYTKTYVHRAGRTARAGRKGRVVTLLRPEDVRHFKDILRKADNAYVKDEKLDRQRMLSVREDVSKALQAMGEALGVGGGAEQDMKQTEHQKQNNGRQRRSKKRKLHGIPEIVL